MRTKLCFLLVITFGSFSSLYCQDETMQIKIVADKTAPGTLTIEIANRGFSVVDLADIKGAFWGIVELAKDGVVWSLTCPAARAVNEMGASFLADKHKIEPGASIRYTIDIVQDLVDARIEHKPSAWKESFTGPSGWTAHVSIAHPTIPNRRLSSDKILIP